MNAYLVRLKPTQMKTAPFSHPLLDEYTKTYTLDEIINFCEALKNNLTEARQQLIFAFLPILKFEIGRYLYYWPLTRKFVDELVSLGIIVIIEAIDKFKEGKIDKDLMQYFLQTLYTRLEEELPVLQGIVVAPKRTNWRRFVEGKSLAIGESENLSSVDKAYYYIEEGFEHLERLEIIKFIENECEQKGVILKEEFWDLSDEEIAAKTGIPRRTIHWYRQELLQRYLELRGEKE